MEFCGTKRKLVNCRLILVETREQKIQKPKILAELIAENYQVQEVNFDTMLSIVQSCQELQAERFNGSLKQGHNSQFNKEPESLNFFTLFKGIVPGTKWCGINDIANDYFDLGKEFELDKCCRAHDHCPMKIKAFGSSYGVKNNHPYTKSHCACDDIFYKCLKNVVFNPAKSTSLDAAQNVGSMFFNMLHLDCIQPVYPKICVESSVLRRIGRFLNWNFFGQSVITVSKDCTRWEEDHDASPIDIKFIKPQRSF